MWFGWLTDDVPYPRTVAEIEKNVTKQSQRNPVSRLFHARIDKEKIAGWRGELNRILQIFNVRSVISPMLASLSICFQTELAIDTNATASDTHNIVSGTQIIVSDTHGIVSDIHRAVVKRQEASDSGNLLVSNYHPLLPLKFTVA